MKHMLPVLVFIASTASAAERPNIIFILTDDQGYGDLACHGNPFIKTPNMDRLHRESVRLTDFHVSPTCSPTRSALMTGRHEFKNGVTHTIYERERMTLKATTLPQLLKSVGYSTAIFGKWHLGDEDDYQPGKRGFDEVFIHGAGGIGQAYPGTSCGDSPGNSYFNPVIRHNGTFEKTDGYCTDVFFDRATKWIETKKDKPFFVYLATNAPHAPLDCPPGSDAPYVGNVPPPVAKFYGMIANIDENIGKLLAKLEEWKIEKNTLVIFMSDNGTATGEKVFNAGMRGKKATPYTGGTRVPAFWRWPGTLPQGVDVSTLSAHYDVLPTLAAIAGARLKGDLVKQVEGRNLLPLLRGEKIDWPERHHVVHVGRWKKGEAAKSQHILASIRNNRWTLVFTDDKKRELFDLKNDSGEATNLLAKNPEVATRLSDTYDAWWKETMPMMVNENAVGPKYMPFQAAYWKQFGGPGPNNAPPPADFKP